MEIKLIFVAANEYLTREPNYAYAMPFSMNMYVYVTKLETTGRSVVCY